jgi:hypothetical protein
VLTFYKFDDFLNNRMMYWVLKFIFVFYFFIFSTLWFILMEWLNFKYIWELIFSWQWLWIALREMWHVYIYISLLTFQRSIQLPSSGSKDNQTNQKAARKMEEAYSSKMSVDFYQSTWHRIRADTTNIIIHLLTMTKTCISLSQCIHLKIFITLHSS